MDSQIATFIKTAIAIIFWPLALGVFIVTWQLSQTQNFQQYASGVISREGGLTKNAIEQIDTESIRHYRGVFRITNSSGDTVTYSNPTLGSDGSTIPAGTYRGGISDSLMKVKPYGTSIKYNVLAAPTAFKDIPVIDNVARLIKIDHVWSTTALNRNAGAIAQDDTNIIDDNSDVNVVLPQNTTVQVKLSDLSSNPDSLLIQNVLQIKGSLKSLEVVDDNREETVATVVENSNKWSIKPLQLGSTSVKLKMTIVDDSGKSETLTRTYVIVVL